MKRIFCMIFGIGIIMVTSGLAQFHEISYPGSAFYGRSHTEDFYIDGGYLHKEYEGFCYCAVNFPDSANGMKVSRLSMTYMDNEDQCWIAMGLYKLDRWTGTVSMVAFLTSEYLPDSSSTGI